MTATPSPILHLHRVDEPKVVSTFATPPERTIKLMADDTDARLLRKQPQR